jgi:hypothetical protein
MYLRTTTIVIAAFLLVPMLLPGQQVDPSVNAIDPTVNSSVQDPDRPGNALLPGGSSAWTGQPIMSQTPSAPMQRVRIIQFPSLAGTTSKWGPTFPAVSSATDTSALGASAWTGQPIMSQPASVLARKGWVSQFPSLAGMSTWGPTSSAVFFTTDGSATDVSALAAGVPNQAQSVLSSTKTASSHKLKMKLATGDLHSAKSSSMQDELALLEQNQLTLSSVAVELRQLRREAARSSRLARMRIADPLHGKADAASAGLWHSDQFSARALAQQQHQSGLLLRYGFNAENRPRRWHRRKTHTPGEKY